MRNVKIFLILIFLITSGILSAQSYSLRGIIVDSITNEPLINTSVFCKLNDSILNFTTADSNGQFQIITYHKNIIIQVQSLWGYLIHSIVLDLEQDSNIIIKMKPLSEAPYEYYYVNTADTVYYNKYDKLNGYQVNGLDGRDGTFCQGKPCNGLTTTYYIDGQVKEIATFTNGVAYDGAYESYYKNGQLSRIGSYANDHRIGQWVFYSEEGQIKNILSYDSQGRMVTQFSFTDKGYLDEYNFHKYDRGCFSFGSSYYENGTLETYFLFQDCWKDLWHSTSFHSNGEIKIRGQSQIGDYDHINEYFDDQGILIKTEYLIDGEIVKTTFPDED
jgi:antitoxin component YwqK of YwqJK toxin-antitoxin module